SRSLPADDPILRLRVLEVVEGAALVQLVEALEAVGHVLVRRAPQPVEEVQSLRRAADGAGGGGDVPRLRIGPAARIDAPEMRQCPDQRPPAHQHEDDAADDPAAVDAAAAD